MTFTGCEASNTCPVFENGGANTLHPSQAMWNDPPPHKEIESFDVDADGGIWISYGSDFRAFDVHMQGSPERVMSSAIWQLKRTAGPIAPGKGPEYDLTLNTGRIQHPLPPEMTGVSVVRYQGAPTQSMYLMGGDAAGRPVINRYDNWESGPKILRSTAMIPNPSYPDDVNAHNDFMYFRIRRTCGVACGRGRLTRRAANCGGRRPCNSSGPRSTPRATRHSSPKSGGRSTCSTRAPGCR